MRLLSSIYREGRKTDQSRRPSAVRKNEKLPSGAVRYLSQLRRICQRSDRHRCRCSSVQLPTSYKTVREAEPWKSKIPTTPLPCTDTQQRQTAPFGHCPMREEGKMPRRDAQKQRYKLSEVLEYHSSSKVSERCKGRFSAFAGRFQFLLILRRDCFASKASFEISRKGIKGRFGASKESKYLK